MIKINKDACIGCGTCAMMCDEVFNIDDDGLACLNDEFNYEEEKENIESAIENCPTSAISEE